MSDAFAVEVRQCTAMTSAIHADMAQYRREGVTDRVAGITIIGGTRIPPAYTQLRCRQFGKDFCHT